MTCRNEQEAKEWFAEHDKGMCHCEAIDGHIGYFRTFPLARAFFEKHGAAIIAVEPGKIYRLKPGQEAVQTAN